MAVQGLFSSAGIGIESTWGTGVSADDIIPLLSEDFSRTHEVDIPEILNQSVAKRLYSVGNELASGKLSALGVIDRSAPSGYIGIEPLIYAALGAGVYDSTNTLNRYYPTSELSKSVTICVRRTDGDDLIEAQGAKVNKLTISGNVSGNRVTVDAEFIAKKILYTGESGVVNDAINAYYNYTPLRMSDLTFLIGDTADALASGDEVQISEFTLEYTNNLTEAEFASGSTYTLEPIVNNFKELNFKFTIPRGTHTDIVSYFTKMKNGTKLQAKLTFTVGSYTFTIYLPYLVVNEPPKQSIDGPNVIPLEVNLTGLLNSSSVNSTMTFVSGTVVAYQLGIEAKSDRTAVPS